MSKVTTCTIDIKHAFIHGRVDRCRMLLRRLLNEVLNGMELHNDDGPRLSALMMDEEYDLEVGKITMDVIEAVAERLT